MTTPAYLLFIAHSSPPPISPTTEIGMPIATSFRRRGFSPDGKGESAMTELEILHALRVLVVDDYPGAAETLRILLELWGHEVRIAHSGKEALTVAGSFWPHVVLLDIEMPGMHGGMVARALRRLPGLASVRIIAATATDPMDSRL